MMDQWTKQIFDQANEVMYRVTAVDGGRLTLTQYSPETSSLAAALNKGAEAASRLGDALEVLRYYAEGASYEAVPADAPVAVDKGAKARSFLDRMAD